jgi:eukaryotic-like serine/threonine-protein kinase
VEWARSTALATCVSAGSSRSRFWRRSFAADPARRERFEREAHALSSLNHPHIAALYDVGEQDGLRFLVMEHVEGETLARRLLHGPVPAKSLVAWAAHTADALAAAHRVGIVHRDLKPSNIVLTKSGVKLIDFGVARLLREGEEDPLGRGATQGATETLTAEGELIGTFGYMAPEQLEGRPIDARTDLFALGIVLFEMATGRRPFEARSQAGIVAAVLSAEPPALSTLNPKLPRALGPVLRRCLEKDPEDRWQSAADLGASLRWIDEAMRRSTTATVVRRRGWLVPAAAGLGVGVLAALLISGVERRRPDAPRGELGAPAIRYEIRPPDGVTFSQSGNPIAISHRRHQGGSPSSPVAKASPRGSG